MKVGLRKEHALCQFGLLVLIRLPLCGGESDYLYLVLLRDFKPRFFSPYITLYFVEIKVFGNDKTIKQLKFSAEV